ncbi:MAG: pyridoxamine 5'-phosphate oxidase family protein [Tissierellia bacterium]|nr:pyridoxamine 5'-phosphate oxidase family protein [Tissierellia bacterium]
MRRKDREMDREYALDIVDRSDYGVLAIAENNIPYTVILSIVRVGDYLYFHSATGGKKVELLKDGSIVSLSFACDVKVPELISREKIEEMVSKGQVATLGSRVYTTEFGSAHIMGRVKKIEDEEEKIMALIELCKKYTPKVYDLANDFIQMSINRTNVYRISIDEISGKRKAFNEAGEELKWGAI